MVSRLSGFSLVELLVAVSLSAGLLAAAWGWAWTLSTASARADETQELRSAAAYVERTLSADIRGASRLVTDEGRGCTRTALTLLPADNDADRVVPVVYDAARGLLWRLTSSCHLVDGLADCRFDYLDAQGDSVDCAAGLSSVAAARVRRVSVTLVLERGRATLRTAWSAIVGGGEL